MCLPARLSISSESEDEQAHVTSPPVQDTSSSDESVRNVPMHNRAIFPSDSESDEPQPSTSRNGTRRNNIPPSTRFQQESRVDLYIPSRTSAPWIVTSSVEDDNKEPSTSKEGPVTKKQLKNVVAEAQRTMNDSNQPTTSAAAKMRDAAHELASAVSVDYPTDGGYFRCPLCIVRFTSNRGLRTHLQLQHKGTFCQKCGKRFKNVKAIFAHQCFKKIFRK